MIKIEQLWTDSEGEVQGTILGTNGSLGKTAGIGGESDVIINAVQLDDEVTLAELKQRKDDITKKLTEYFNF